MNRWRPAAAALAALLPAACGMDLAREDGPLEVSLLGRDALSDRLVPLAPGGTVSLAVDHEGTTSTIESAEVPVVHVESVPAGGSHVSARAGGLASNTLEVEVFAGVLTRVALTLTSDPDADLDADGLTSRNDNCAFAANPAQADG
ncbi:MAG: hypothetical protein HYZ27_05505, partial [Deltaproteobacteria bacterium]|nr:hypothetical protein [Deltaproteobacteria bacterium]